MQQLGLSVGQDGKLTLDNSTLDAALNSNFADITGFLQNSGSFGQSLTTTLNSLGSVSTTGAIYLAKQENTAKETALNQSIADEDARLATQKTNLTNELNAANQILQSIPDQLSEIDQIYSAVTGYNTGNGN
jgi:flagellar hook-associated protein 2